MTIIPSLPNEIAVHILAFLPRAFFSTLGLVCRSWRDALQPDGPVIAFWKRRNLLETWIIFMSVKDGHLQFLLVDPVHCGCLEIVPPSPISSPIARNMSLGLSSPMVVGSEVLIPAESLQQGSRLYCFDVQSMQWKDSFPFFTKRPFPIMYATAQGDECVYFAGGASHSGDLKEAKRLVIKTRMWEALPDMQEKRVYASGVVLQGQFCVIGGYHKLLSGSVNTGEIWDPNSRQWTLIPELWPANIFGEYTRKPCIAETLCTKSDIS